MTNSAWSHLTVYEALVRKANKVKKSDVDRYVQMYQQNVNCAVLYNTQAKYKAAPIHLNSTRSSWDEAIWKKIQPHLKHVGDDNKGPGKENQNFKHYEVLNWAGLAEALEL